MTAIGGFMARLCMVACLTGSMGRAQNCPTKQALTLAQILGEIANHVPDNRIVELIRACHVSFSFTPAIVDQLAASNPPTTVINALDSDTISRLTLVQAHNAVAELERQIADNERVGGTTRDAALGKLDEEFGRQRDQAAVIEPKGPYEKTAEYEDRVRKNKEKLAAMDRAHNGERSRLEASSLSDVATRNAPSQRRIAALKNGLYSVTAVPVFATYDADTERLTAMIDNEEYWFSVRPERARALSEHWSEVRVKQKYTDDERNARFLSDRMAAEPVAGASRRGLVAEQISALMAKARRYAANMDYSAAISAYNDVLKLKPDYPAAKEGIVASQASARSTRINGLLSEARAGLGNRDFTSALRTYREVLQLDPDNQAAKAGISSTQASAEAEAKVVQERAAKAEREAASARQLRASLTSNPKLIQGAWFDAATGLLWTSHDNGKNVTWESGAKYCQSLRIGDFSDWHLATIEQLQALYDPTRSRRKMSGKQAWDWFNSTEPSNVLVPGLQSYHIKGDIALSNLYSWSSSLAPPGKDGPEAWFFTFEKGAKLAVTVKAGDGRALCVHQ